MTALDKWIEDNANLTLWCVHLLGPDEVEATPSHAAAVERARQINEHVHGSVMPDKDGDDNTIICFAYAAPWPWSKDDHAESLKQWPAA